MSKVEKLFISNTSLTGYKSIENLSTTLKSGLNIIIGKNAVGKTNFLNFFHNCLNFSFSHSNNFNANFSLNYNQIDYSFTFIKKTVLQNDVEFIDDKSERFKIRRFQPNFLAKLDVIDTKNNISGNFSSEEENQCGEYFKKQLLYDGIEINSTLIKHGLPKNYSIIDSPLNIELWDSFVSDEFLNLYNAENQSVFFKTLLSATLTDNILNPDFFNKKIRSEKSIQKFISERKRDYKKDVLDSLEYLTDLKFLLKEYSPIEDFRFNDSFSIDIDLENEKISLRNFFLEFMVDKKWFSFEDLSDGTKRIFYIISEIFILDRNNFINTLNNNSVNNNLNVIFIEEPELGIHPHQLFRLMKFLKEKSRSNQIVITTHSPLSLDILETSELDSILIAEKLDGQTQLKRLSKEKIDKAKMYMSDLNLSDFWLNSDLED